MLPQEATGSFALAGLAIGAHAGGTRTVALDAVALPGTDAEDVGSTAAT